MKMIDIDILLGVASMKDETMKLKEYIYIYIYSTAKF